MEDASDPVALLDVPGHLLDKVVEVLAKVGIDVPALALQLFLLVLVLITAFVVVRGLGSDWRSAKLPALLSAGAVGLVAGGIVFGIVSQMLLPDRLVGRVTGPELSGARVELLDFRGEAVSSGGAVDSDSGEFIAYYSPAWNGRARTLRISSSTCKPREEPIARNRLERGVETGWDFPCERP